MARKIIDETDYKEIFSLLHKELSVKEIAKKFHVDEKTIRNILYKHGYKYDRHQELWYAPFQDDRIMYIMNNCDIEAEIEFLSSKRYYDRYINGYPGNLHEEEKDTVEIYREIYEEFDSIYAEYGCDFASELIELVLLRFLDKNRKKDYTKEFENKYIKEYGEELDD